METFVYSIGVITCLVSLVCGFTLAYSGVNYILVRNNLNVFQKGVYMVSWSYVSMMVGYLFTMLLPIFITLLVANDMNHNFSFIKNQLNHGLNSIKTSIQEETKNDMKETRPTDNVEHSESCDCVENDCDEDKCCRVETSTSKVGDNEEETSELVKSNEEGSKSALELLTEEITQITQVENVTDGEQTEKLQTTD